MVTATGRMMLAGSALPRHRFRHGGTSLLTEPYHAAGPINLQGRSDREETHVSLAKINKTIAPAKAACISRKAHP
jgi:hypothetical protein